jgi:WD40 repeat protein
VVAGDGTGDRLIARDVRRLAPVWRPGQDHVIAFVDRSGDVRVVDADRGATRGAWHERGARELLWSPDGVVLLSRTATSLDLHAATGARIASIRGEFIAAAWAPGGRTLALVAYDAMRDRSDVTIRTAPRGPSRRVFSGTGRIEQVEWSPDSHWLLLPWRTADQWLFAPTGNVGSLRAVASITSQFHSRAFPRLAGWCCG